MFIQSLLLTVKAGFLEKTPYDMLPLEEVPEEKLMPSWSPHGYINIMLQF